jgi:hypothetical protein
MKSAMTKGICRLALFLLLAVCVVTFTASRIAHSLSLRGASRHSELSPKEIEKARQLLLGGVGSQVSLLTESARSGQVQASIDSLAGFIVERSGLSVTRDVTDRLNAMEQRALDGACRRIACDELSDTVLSLLVERFRHSTDAEIERAASGLAANVRTSGASAGKVEPISKDGTSAAKSQQAVNAAKVPGDDFDRVMLRADGRGIMKRTDFVEAAKLYRTRISAPVQMMAIVELLRPMVRRAFQNRLGTLSQGLPEQWGDSMSRGLTPARAFLLSYSVIADDPMYRSREEIRSAMRWAEEARMRNGSTSQAAARLPYGTNGCLFSAPVDLILDNRTSIALLDKLSERTSK